MADETISPTLPIPAARGRAGASLQILTSAAASAFVGLLAVCVLGRISYPFDLEVMEGGMADHVDRVRAGGLIYARPGLEFTSFLYAPLYYYVSAAAAALTGDSLIALRTVSVVCTGATMTVLGLLVRRLGGSCHAATLAAGLYAASYQRVLAFHDIARVDPLFVLLVLTTILLVHRRPMGVGRAVLAGCLAAAAVHTKQLAVVALAPLGLWALILGGRSGRIFCAVTVAATSVVAGILEWVHDGWYSYYLLEVPSGHRLVDRVWETFWTEDVLPVWGIALVLASVGLIPWALARRARAREVLFAVAVLLGVVCAAYLGRLHEGGEPNTIMPMVAGVAVLAALALAGIRALADERGRAARVVAAAAEIAVLVQFGRLAYDPAELIPGRVDRVVAARTIQDLEDLDRPVFVLTESRVFAVMGRTPHAHSVAMFDVIKGTENPNDSSSSRLPRVSGEFKSEFGAAIDERRYAAIVYPFFKFLDNGKSYRLTNVVYSPTFLGGTGLPTMTGRLQRPLFIYVPRP